MKAARTVGELISILQSMEADRKLIGATCRRLVVVEQDSGAVLIAEARSEDLRPTLVAANG